MRKLLTSNITTLASMPIKSGSLTHIQNAYTELINSLAGALVGNSYGTLGQFALIGCNNIDTLPDVDIQAGFILYNGTIYEVDAVAFTPGGGQVAVANIVTTYFTATNADPVEFTDGNNHNVHEIKKIAFSSGATGSGIFDYSALNFVQIQPSTEVSYDPNWDDGGTNGARYRRNRDGLVDLTGVVYANGTPGIGDSMFHLPTGYRPPNDLIVPGMFYNQTDLLPCFISITASNGRVYAIPASGFTTFANNDQIYMNIQFYNS